mgnify:CR=1 FL=1
MVIPQVSSFGRFRSTKGIVSTPLSRKDGYSMITINKKRYMTHIVVATTFGLFNQTRKDQNGYLAFPFEAGKKTGMIQGFIEGMSLMDLGDKILIYMPSKLAYGERDNICFSLLILLST